MKKIIVFLLSSVGFLCVLAWATFVMMRASRPPTPPDGSPIVYPWGAMHVDTHREEPDSDLEKTIAASIMSEPEDHFDPDHDGVCEYAVLVLSGGGSAGAFGAGLLSGWSKSGTRPDFKIVTGVSAGSLQATFAFLGPEYDDDLTAVFTEYASEDIYERRTILGALLGDAAWGAEGLKKLIANHITSEVLEAVAAKHAEGHRLFVGTANIDTGEFTIWNMGAIASSNKPGKLEHYRKVLLASSAIPVLFPPVYLPVEIGGELYYEMHVDGGSQSQLFLRGFMLDFEETLQETGIDDKSETSIYVIRNGVAQEGVSRHIVDASSVSIASATITGVFDLSTESSLFRVWVLSQHHDVDFNLAAIPDGMFPSLTPTEFDLDVMGRIYAYAYGEAEKGYVWAKQPPGLDIVEQFDGEEDRPDGTRNPDPEKD